MKSAGAEYVMCNLSQSFHRAWTIFAALSANASLCDRGGNDEVSSHLRAAALYYPPNSIWFGGQSMLNRQFLERMREPLGNAPCLPGFAYSDPGVAQQEFDRIFGCRWIGVGFGEQIPAPGDVLPVVVAGRTLLLARGADGQIRVFYNSCRHRGLQLVEGSCPKSVRAITCPYHGWAYDLNGRCLGIPYWERENGKPFHPSADDDYGLIAVRATVWLDIVFVDLSDRAPAFEELVAPLQGRWRLSDIPPLSVVTSWEAKEEFNWKLAIENFVDAYHLSFVHAQAAKIKSTADHQIVSLSEDIFGIRYLGEARRPRSEPLPHIPVITDACGGNMEGFHIFPNTLLIAYPSFLQLRIVLPIDAGLTHQREVVYVAAEAKANRFADQLEQFAKANKLINDQDVPIVHRLQSTRAFPQSVSTDRGRFVPEWDARSNMFQIRIVETLLDASPQER
jgi:choline monooxygenase